MLWILNDTPLSVRLLNDGGAILIGDTFSSDPLPQQIPARSAVGLSIVSDARRLSRAFWGRYIALLANREELGVYRDPSGHLDALLWAPCPGIQFVASELDRTPLGLAPRRLSLHWERISEFLARPAATTTAPLVDGLDAIGPGDLRTFGRAAGTFHAWTPSDFVEQSADGHEAAAELVRRVDNCANTLVRGHERVLFELSGGVDSSILAGALDQMRLTPRVAQWLNWVGERAEADEMAYARAVGDRLGVNVIHVPKIAATLKLEDLAELGSSLWPAMSGIDAARDRDEVERLALTGATAILSGQGGDAVFFQMKSALVVADAWRHQRLRVFSGPLLPNVARRTQRSVWSVVGQMAAAQFHRPTIANHSGCSLLSRELRSVAAELRHVWVRDAESRGVPPAKRLQIEAIANCHVYHGQSRRRRRADLLYPLLAQPVVELCLSIPAHHLAGSAHDRSYAREVFRERIPEVVRRRRAKGAFNAYFSRLVAMSADTLRPYLMDGCLAEAGLLDRTALDQAIDPANLIQAGRPTEVLWAASVESWIRYWQTRLPDSAAAPRPRP